MGEIAVPSFEEVRLEVGRVRERGLGKLRNFPLPHLQAACRLAELSDDSEQEPAAIEALLRQAVAWLGGGTMGDAAEATFGLEAGEKYSPAAERRKRAARAQSVGVDRFRRAYEPAIIEQTAEGVMALCHEARLRQARRQMEQRHPADSRLAVQWVERFEAYYRIWTPVYALAADLEAAVKTYRDEPADHLPWDPQSAEPYDPVDQAEGYARCALYAYVEYLLELKRFKTKHGGLWLLSDADVEQEVADAIYGAGWHNPLNTDDDSWLRRFLADARHEEPEHFSQMMRAVRIGSRIYGEWQDFVAACHCSDLDAGDSDCQVHSTIRACRTYCDLVDQDWLRIADWYRPGSNPRRGISGERLFAEHVAAVQRNARK